MIQTTDCDKSNKPPTDKHFDCTCGLEPDEYFSQLCADLSKKCIANNNVKPKAGDKCRGTHCIDCNNEQTKGVKKCTELTFIDFMIDGVSIGMFFVFWMLNFWFTVAGLTYEFIKYLYTAPRSVQLSVGVIAGMLLLTISIHLFCLVGFHHYKQEAPFKAVTASIKNVSSKDFSKMTTKEKEIVLQEFLKMSTKEKEIALKENKDLANIIKENPFRISLLNSSRQSTDASDVKTFVLTIRNNQNKKIFETTKEIAIPDSDGNIPQLEMALDKVQLINY